MLPDAKKSQLQKKVKSKVRRRERPSQYSGAGKGLHRQEDNLAGSQASRIVQFEKNCAPDTFSASEGCVESSMTYIC